MSGTVFAHRHGVVGVNKDVGHLHERRQTHGIASIFHEDQKGPGERAVTAMKLNAVADRRHAEFPNAVAHILIVSSFTPASIVGTS